MEEDLSEYDSVPFICYCCRKPITGLQEFNVHLEKCHFKCEICGRAFLNEGKKFHHYNLHTSNGGNKWNERRSYIGETQDEREYSKIKFQCEFCQEVLSTIEEWRNHRTETHSMEYSPNQRDDLIDPLAAMDLVMTRLVLRAQKSFSYLVKCPAENCGFYPATQVYGHIKKDHPNSTLRYNCSICGDIFSSELDVMEHRLREHREETGDEESEHNSQHEDEDPEVCRDSVLQAGSVAQEVSLTGGLTVSHEVDVTAAVQQALSRHQQQETNSQHVVSVPVSEPITKQSSVFLTQREEVVSPANSVNLAHQVMDIKTKSKRGRKRKTELSTSSLQQLNSSFQQHQEEDGVGQRVIEDIHANIDLSQYGDKNYVTFVEGEDYVDEKNDLQLNLTIVRAPNYSQEKLSKSPLSSKPRPTVPAPAAAKQRLKLRPDLVPAANSYLTVVNPSEQLHASEVVEEVDQQASMIVMSTPDIAVSAGEHHTYIIQNEDGTQIQEIQAKVITDTTQGIGDTVVDTTEAEQILGTTNEQTILHVPGADGQQPTFVIQSQDFQVT